MSTGQHAHSLPVRRGAFAHPAAGAQAERPAGRSWHAYL
ncbi:hypothetical protein Thpro_023028 [Acidihalobacter prosperus]|uniref:Uncharacterized protein n=1 Tax=Acidihalobacter prosperus TaxID=160660 RepID=A0A1A6C2J6_9GAMM|nr:hypothetical protein Thpro_023028 [Acidihalobacter prosperus]